MVWSFRRMAAAVRHCRSAVGWKTFASRGRVRSQRRGIQSARQYALVWLDVGELERDQMVQSEKEFKLVLAIPVHRRGRLRGTRR